MQNTPALLAPALRSTLDVRAPEFAENRTAMLEKLAEIDRLLDEAEAGGGPEHHARLAKRGKLPVRERIALALDPDSPFLEISPLAGYNSDFAIGGGAVLGIGVIAGVECVIFANGQCVEGAICERDADGFSLCATDSFAEHEGAPVGRPQAIEQGHQGAAFEPVRLLCRVGADGQLVSFAEAHVAAEVGEDPVVAEVPLQRAASLLQRKAGVPSPARLERVVPAIPGDDLLRPAVDRQSSKINARRDPAPVRWSETAVRIGIRCRDRATSSESFGKLTGRGIDVRILSP